MAVIVERDPRSAHRIEIVEALRSFGAATRAELCDLTGLSRPTVSTLVAQLAERGIVIEHGAPRGTRTGGRPPGLVSLNPRAGVGIGVDVGVRHVATVVASPSDAIHHERRWDLPARLRPGDAARKVVESVQETLAEAGVGRRRVIGVVIGVGAPVRADDGLIGDPRALPGVTSERVAGAVRATLGAPVVVDNTATLAALGELTTQPEARDLVHVGWSHRIGGGIVSRGKPYRGFDGFAGEVGHVCLDPSGPHCWCGGRGCVETYAGGDAMLRALGEHAAGGRPVAWSDDAALDRLVERALTGDPCARQAVVTAARALGRGIAALVQATNPARVVVGGPLSRLWPVAADPVRDELVRWSPVARMSDVAVDASSIGERAALLGAVSVVLQHPERFLGRRDRVSSGRRAR